MISLKLALCLFHPRNRKMFALTTRHASIITTLILRKAHPLFYPNNVSSLASISTDTSHVSTTNTIEEEASQYDAELAAAGELFPPYPTLYMPPNSTVKSVKPDKSKLNCDDDMYVIIEKDMFGADYYNSNV